MAYWIQYSGTCENGGRRGYICEAVSDVADLPTQNKIGVKQDEDNEAHRKCAYGSEAYVIADGSRYMLDKTSGEWKKLQNVSSGGSGGTGGLEILGDGGIFLTMPSGN